MFSDLLDRTTDGSRQTDDRYFRLATPDWNSKNPLSVQAVVRVLDERPVKMDQHWFQNAEGRNVPLVCPGRKNCPACSARSRAYREGDPGWKELYRSGSKYLFNAALQIEGKLQVRIWSVTYGVFKDIDFCTARKGYEDVRQYDFEVTKIRIGPAPMNVEWKVFPNQPTGFTKEYQELLEQRFDLNEEATPASTEEIHRAMSEQAGLHAAGPMGNGVSRAVTFEQLAELNTLAAAKDYTLEALGIDVATLTQEQAEHYIQDLKS